MYSAVRDFKSSIHKNKVGFYEHMYLSQSLGKYILASVSKIFVNKTIQKLPVIYMHDRGVLLEY